MKIIDKIKSYYKSAYTMGHFPSWVEVFTTKKKIYAYYGFLGDNNFGDELVFESAKKIFEPHILFPFRRFMPVSMKMYSYFFKKRFSGIVIGGGTLIGPLFWNENFFTTLLALKIPVYVHGTGVHKNLGFSKTWESVFNEQVFGGVRGEISKANLIEIYPSAKIAGDAAFVFFDKHNWNLKPADNRNVLINIGTHLNYEEQMSSRMELKTFIKSLIDNKYNVQFLPFHFIDNQLGAQLKEEFPEIELLEQPKNYICAENIFKNCSFAIGERLHFTVMAILSHCPFISINYRSKHVDLLESIGLSHAGLQPGKFSSSLLYDIFCNRFYFNWACSENMLAKFKQMQISEASNFMSGK